MNSSVFLFHKTAFFPTLMKPNEKGLFLSKETSKAASLAGVFLKETIQQADLLNSRWKNLIKSDHLAQIEIIRLIIQRSQNSSSRCRKTNKNEKLNNLLI
jgi:hypothetical protein